MGEEAAGGAEPDTEGPRSHVTVGGGGAQIDGTPGVNERCLMWR